MKITKDYLKKVITEELTEAGQEVPGYPATGALRDILKSVKHDDLNLAIGAFTELERILNAPKDPNKEEMLSFIRAGKIV